LFLTGMPDESDKPVEDGVAHQAREIERLTDALGLLGVNACSWCKKFYRRTDPGALFDSGGKLICYGCIHEWWPECCTELSIKDRENLEGKLVFWLRDYHHAETFKDPAKLPESSQQELCIIATCLECKGTGKSLGQDSCRFCEGRGTVWVIVSRKK
jgi:hypothetical protein